MIKMNYILNDKTFCLEAETQISGPQKILKTELGMIIFYLIENKQIDKESIDNLTDIVNDAVNTGLTSDEMLNHFFKAAFGINLNKRI
jgi:hypothetical protein